MSRYGIPHIISKHTTIPSLTLNDILENLPVKANIGKINKKYMELKDSNKTVIVLK